MQKILEIKNLTYKYEEASDSYAVNDVSFDILRGEWVSIIGRNGSGKSTTARLIDGLMAAASGEIWIDGELLTQENVWQLRQKIGMVFQNPDNQFVGATVEDDVAFGMENQGVSREDMLARVETALSRVDMTKFKTKEPARLSGGQKQRVAIARALITNPKVILADEPTGALDSQTTHDIMKLLQDINNEGKTIIVVTHEPDVAAQTKRNVHLRDGIIETDEYIQQVVL